MQCYGKKLIVDGNVQEANHKQTRTFEDPRTPTLPAQTMPHPCVSRDPLVRTDNRTEGETDADGSLRALHIFTVHPLSRKQNYVPQFRRYKRHDSTQSDKGDAPARPAPRHVGAGESAQTLIVDNMHCVHDTLLRHDSHAVRQGWSEHTPRTTYTMWARGRARANPHR